MYPNDAGFLFSYKSQKWAHSELCNHFCNAVDGQKDKSVGYIFRWISPKPSGMGGSADHGRIFELLPGDEKHRHTGVGLAGFHFVCLAEPLFLTQPSILRAGVGQAAAACFAAQRKVRAP